jgi:transcriptional regulator with XRE-family HTH domain
MKTIRELREEHGLTQLELAIRIGVTPASIYNWESGRYQPRTKQLRDMAQAFGVSSDDIVLVEPDPAAKKTRRLG